MSYKVYFTMSTGLVEPITAPTGSLQTILDHVAHIEQTLGLKKVRYEKNPYHWESRGRFVGVSDEDLCQHVEQHNLWVRWLYDRIDAWAKEPPTDGELITPKDAAKFWHGLELLTVPPQRWTRDYYVARMHSMYQVLRGEESEGVTLGAGRLTPKQAAAVINMFSPYLDTHDMRLDVPRGHDYLASSYDGGYDWCEKCGAVTFEDSQRCQRRKCPIEKEGAETC